MKIAFMFPGQGSQSVGMLGELFEDFAVVRNVFHAADTALNMPLLSLVTHGPAEDLNLTCNTQPALLTASVACAAVLHQYGIEAEAVAGHSLGEYSALVYAKAVSFEDAVVGVRSRGTFMQEAVPVGEGAMAAVIGAETKALEDLCDQVADATGEVVEPVNYNCPGQVVIAGKATAVAEVLKTIKEKKMARAVRLPVSAPFHSSLMAPAAEKLSGVLAEVDFADAVVPLYSNVTAMPVKRAEHIKRLLVKQAASPVLWERSIRNMIRDGFDTFVEVGPGHALSNLVKRIDDKVMVLQTDSREDLQNTLRVLKGV